MAEIQLRQSETDRDRLPDVCIACGQPATSFIRKTFAWHPPWVIVIILAGLLPYVIVALILTKRMTVEAPVCDKHRGYWWKRQMLMWMPLLLLFLCGIGLAIAAGNMGDKDTPGIVCFASGAAGVVWLFVAVVIQSMMIRPTEITNRTIRLKRVHEGFVDAFDQLRRGRDRDFDRDYDDDVEDYDERMRRRRERRAKERSGYDDDRRESFRAERDADEPPDERIRPRD
jgi:hypothetical protein